MATNSFTTGIERKVMIAIAALTGVPWTEVPLRIPHPVSYGLLTLDTHIPTSDIAAIIGTLEAKGELAIERPFVASRSRNTSHRIYYVKRKDRRERIYDRDGRLCIYCGATDKLTLDHVQPTSRGGRDRMDNLVTACWTCNNRKGDLLPANFIFAQYAFARHAR